MKEADRDLAGAKMLCLYVSVLEPAFFQDLPFFLEAYPDNPLCRWDYASLVLCALLF